MSEKISTKKLYVTVFLTGAIVMVLELIGSRILAPNLGTSTFVWASLIGVILGAMSGGYYWGGKIADKQPSLGTFSLIIFLSGISVFMIIMFRHAILDLSPYFGVRAGSIFASAFLFAIPSFLLGMVSPYAVRLNMEKVENSGRTVGNLYAVSTFGSIAGTFAAGFYLIPNFGSINILYGLALSLFAISVFCSPQRKKTAVLLGALCLMGCSMAAEAMTGNRYLYQADSAYNNIRVFDSEANGRPVRIMSVEDFSDSGIYLDSDELFFEYTKYYALDEPFIGQVDKAVIFGGAAYSVPKDFLRRNTQGTIDVVEIDPKTTEVAKAYFDLKDNPRMNIIYDDARIFLNESQKEREGKYDVVYNDAFSSACAPPSHLATREAAEEVYGILDDDGAYIMNLISSVSGEDSVLFRSEYKTLREVFDNVYVFPARYAEASLDVVQNIIIVATKKEKDVKKIQKKYPDGNLGRLLAHYYDGDIKTDDVKTMTDDFSPIGYYGARICDSLR